MSEDVYNLSRNTVVTVGVVGDTHIPDRVDRLHPDLIPGLLDRKPDLIFHTGDICQGQVLDELGQIAPVFAVRGNRDWFLPDSVKMTRIFILQGQRILLTHGHVNAWHYWMDKVAYLVNGYQPKRYVQRLKRIDPTANVIVFGHSHRAEKSLHNGVLFFNPGSSCSGDLTSPALSYGFLEIHPDGKIEPEIIPLRGYWISSGKWVKKGKKQKQFSDYS